ncbi:MAG TPA: Uma2 family endonuclease [Acidimicrobiia bacterium]|nr:Uma2 family endonuclease [Acidimicrobiia bacterium]
MPVRIHVGPWTEEDLVGLPDDGQRYELLEGALLVNPPPGGRHQRVSLRLAGRLDAIAPDGLIVVEAMGVRIPGGSVLIPDVLVAQRDAVLANDSGILDAAVVHLLAEIVSPGSRTQDRLTKPALYAEAGIPSFWRVELDDGLAIHAYRLEGSTCVQVATARAGQRLELEEPFPISLDPADLIP